MTEEQATRIIHYLFECHYPPLVLYAKRYTRTVEQAEDVVQDAILQLYTELREGKQIDNPVGWAVVVVRRQAQKISGQGARFVAFDDSEHRLQAPQASASYGDAELEAFFPVLTEREREVIFLRLGGLKYREIAKELKITISSVNTMLARALRKLQSVMTGDASPKRQMRGDGDEVTETLQ